MQELYLMLAVGCSQDMRYVSAIKTLGNEVLHPVFLLGDYSESKREFKIDHTLLCFFVYTTSAPTRCDNGIELGGQLNKPILADDGS